MGRNRSREGKEIEAGHAPVLTREPNAERTARLKAAGGRHNISAYTDPQTRVMFFGTGATTSPIDIPEEGTRVVLHIEDGSWQHGYRAVTGVKIESDFIGDVGHLVVWVCGEVEWHAARAENRPFRAAPWPINQLMEESSMVMQAEVISENTPDIHTPMPGPLAQAYLTRDDAIISPSYTRSYPFVMSHGKGNMVWDVDGNRFIDFTAGIAVLATGHAHPEVVQAIQAQAERYIHMAGTDFYLPNAVELAETLCRVTPGSFDKQVFFTNSGTEAIEAAMKLCRHHTGRPVLISFMGAFHGRTYGSMSLSSSKYLHRTKYQPLVGGIYHAPYPNTYRPPFDVPTERLGRACVDYIEKTMFRHLVSSHEVAGIFVETIQGEGGYIVPPDDFYPALRDLCDRHEIPLVLDEVQSGMGRTGKMFAIEHWGVEPDVVCIAKGIASGMPMGAIVARKSMMTWPSGAHANTYGGNALAVEAALATIRLLEGGLMENATRVGEHMMSRVKTWLDRYSFVGDVRGKGLMIGVDIVSDRATKAGDGDLRDRIVDESFKRGLLLLGAGSSTIRFCPPLVLDEATADEGLAVMERVMDSI